MNATAEVERPFRTLKPACGPCEFHGHPCPTHALDRIQEIERRLSEVNCCPVCRLLAGQCSSHSLRSDREVARAVRRAIQDAQALLAELRR